MDVFEVSNFFSIDSGGYDNQVYVTFSLALKAGGNGIGFWATDRIGDSKGIFVEDPNVFFGKPTRQKPVG